MENADVSFKKFVEIRKRLPDAIARIVLEMAHIDLVKRIRKIQYFDETVQVSPTLALRFQCAAPQYRLEIHNVDVTKDVTMLAPRVHKPWGYRGSHMWHFPTNKYGFRNLTITPRGFELDGGPNGFRVYSLYVSPTIRVMSLLYEMIFVTAQYDNKKTKLKWRKRLNEEFREYLLHLPDDMRSMLPPL